MSPLLHVQDVIISSDSFLQNAQPLKSILESIPISEDVWNGLEKTMSELANVSSLHWIGLPKLITDFAA